MMKNQKADKWSSGGKEKNHAGTAIAEPMNGERASKYVDLA